MQSAPLEWRISSTLAHRAHRVPSSGQSDAKAHGGCGTQGTQHAPPALPALLALPHRPRPAPENVNGAVAKSSCAFACALHKEMVAVRLEVVVCTEFGMLVPMHGMLALIAATGRPCNAFGTWLCIVLGACTCLVLGTSLCSVLGNRLC